MSSPKRRIETDVMKMYAAPPRLDDVYPICSPRYNYLYHILRRIFGKYKVLTDLWPRLMSDYEVTLVNDNMYVPSPSSATVLRLLVWSSILTAILIMAELQARILPPFQGGLWKIHVELPDQYPYKSPSIGFVNRIYHPNIDELSGSVCLDVINQTWSPMYDMINIFEVFLPQLLRYPNPSDPLNGDAAAVLMRDPKKYEARVREYVVKYASKDAADEAGEDSESEDEMSSVGSYESGNEEPAGEMDDV
ncbi:hypothetical protein FQN50_009378 [Emmonsiellopsis sp. PD_5]|nr:hypothetical protein FQN50_009378 [Emmonsiellopsis sp. PD_5]